MIAPLMNKLQKNPTTGSQSDIGQSFTSNNTICTTLNMWMTDEIDNMLSQHGFDDDTELNTTEPITQTSKNNIHKKLT